MEKSNSFKRVLAGTLALLTVASSVPADAGSVIGDFFSTALVANAEAAPVERTVAVTNLAISGNAGTAKVKVGNNEVVDATVAVTTPNENTPNVKQLVITTTANAFAEGNAVVTVGGYTVIDTVATAPDVDKAYNATATTTALTVKVNAFTSITANGATEFEFDGTAKSIKYGKHIADEAALDTDGNNTVEVAYIDADGKYQVITEDELKDPALFTWSCDTLKTGESVGEDATTHKNVCVIKNVNRADGKIDGQVIPHVITVTGHGKYEGLEVGTNLLITALDITNSVAVTGTNDGTNFTIPHVTYDTHAVGAGQIIKSAKVKDKADAAEHNLTVAEDYTLSFEGRTDTEAGQTGVLTGDDGKVSENAADNVNAVNVGLYTATLNFGGNYTGTAKQSFRIMPAPLNVDGIKATVVQNPVTTIDGTSTTAAPKTKFNAPTTAVTYKDYTVSYTKVYDRASDISVVKAAAGEENPYGLTLTTYKAEKIDNKGTDATTDDEITWSASPVTDYKNVGLYKTVITVSGNYVAANKDAEAAIVWSVTPYNISTDKTTASEEKPNRFVDNALAADNTHPWVGFAVNPATGNIEPAFNLRDNVETDLAAQAGALLNLGTDFTVQYRENGTTDWSDKIPDGLSSDDKIDVKITGIGNYATGVEAGTTVDAKTSEIVTGVKISAYTLTPGDTVLTKKVGNNEQVKYQYGDTITAAVQGVPQVLTQESRYYAVDLNENGAPTGGTEATGLQKLTALVKAVTDADAEIAAATTNEARATAVTKKKTAIDNLYNATTPANVNADETPGKGYVVVVFVNRDGDKYKDNANAAEKAKYNDGYKSFFDSTVGVSKGITVSRREITDNSTVEIEYDNSLLPYKGGQYSNADLEKNIKSIKVDGIELTGAAGVYADFDVKSTKTKDTEIAADFRDVDNYTMKLDFGDGAFTAGDNFKGSYTTKLDTQKFSIVASALTAADFTVNGAAIQAVYVDANGVEVIEGVTLVDANGKVVNEGADAFDHEHHAAKDKFTFAYYKAKQDVEYADAEDPRTVLKDGGKIVYDGKEWDARVTPTKYNRQEYAGTANARYIDFEVTGDKQTDAGPYEITISGVKNTKGSVTVKWSVEGNSFAGFTATPDKTSFDYNGQGQAPKFTVVKPADEATNKPAVTLTEGKDFAVEYYNGTTQLDGKPVSVGKYTAKIVGIGAYYGAKYPGEGFQFTISPASDLDVTITAKEGADFSYNGETLINRVNDLFDVKVAGKKLEEDADNFIYKIVQDDGKDSDAKNAKNVGKYKISVTVYDDNYQPKTSDQTPFEITPKEITLSNITANVKTAVYGAPVAQINDSITFDYDGVIEADADKVSVADFRGFVVVSDNYRSGSPAGEYTLVYNGSYVPVSEAAQNYKAKKFTSNEKITVAKKDLADAKPYVSLVVVPSTFTNDDPEYVEKGQELKANQIVYNGIPYEVYIQDNDNGLMTMADLKLTGTPKAIHAGSDLEVVATASANGNYTGTATLNLAWAINQCEIGYDVDVSVARWIGYGEVVEQLAEANQVVVQNNNDDDEVPGTYKYKGTGEEYPIGSTLTENNNVVTQPIPVSAGFGSDYDAWAGKPTYFISTNVRFYTVDANTGAKTYIADGLKFSTSYYDDSIIRGDNTLYDDADTFDVVGGLYASEEDGDYTVYFYQLDDKGEPIEETKTTGYPTTGGKYRATVEFSKDFKLVNTSPATEDPDFVPQPAKVGYVDFEVKGTPVNSAIYDLNQLNDNADLTDDYRYDNKGTAFSRVYGDAITPEFQIDVYGTNTGSDLVTAKVDVTKMRKFVADDKGAYTIGDTKYSLSDTVYDGTAGYYDLEGAVVMNNTDYSCSFQNVGGFPKAYFGRNEVGTLVYEVERSTDYTIQFDHENNVFALSGGKAVAGYQVVDDNSGKVMTEGVDYKLKGSNEVYKTGTYTLFVEGIGNYAGTDNADWTVVASGADTTVDAKLLDSNTVSFKDQVEFNFLAEINDPEYVDGAYVIFTYDHYGEKTEVKKMLSKTDMYGKYYRFRLPLTASEMAIPVKAELYLKNSAKPVSTKERSIKDYAETAIAKNLDGSNVLKAMLNYGGYTQVALGNNTSLLANASADIKEDVSAVDPKSATTFVRPTAYEGTTTVGVAGIPQSVKIKFTPSVTYKGTTVMTKSKLYVRHYFTVASTVDEDELKAIKVYRPDKGRVDNLVDLDKNSTGYYFDMDAEFAYNLDRANGTVKVYDYPGIVTNAESYTAANGQVVAAGATTYKVGARELQGKNGHDYAAYNDYYYATATNANVRNHVTEENGVNIYAIEIHNYNVVDYCEAIANNSKQTTANKNMVKALYAYYQAANDYVAGRTKA